MENFKPVDFYSKISDYVLIFKDREVKYHGLKETEIKPSTKIKFMKGKYTCTDKYVYDLIKASKAYKVGRIVIAPTVKGVQTAKGIVFKKTMLQRMSRDELADLAGQLDVVLDVSGDEATKQIYVSAIMDKQDDAKPVEVEKPTTAIKGGVTTSNSTSVDPSIVVPTPEV